MTTSPKLRMLSVAGVFLRLAGLILFFTPRPFYGGARSRIQSIAR